MRLKLDAQEETARFEIGILLTMTPPIFAKWPLIAATMPTVSWHESVRM